MRRFLPIPDIVSYCYGNILRFAKKFLSRTLTEYFNDSHNSDKVFPSVCMSQRHKSLDRN